MRLRPLRIFQILNIVFLSLLLTSCGALKKRQGPDQTDLVTKPLTQEERKEVLSQVGGNWFYGSGIGETALTIGTVAAFPPYAAIVLGNALLSFAGYEPLKFSDALPEGERESWSNTYDGIVSGPGRLTAAVAGEEYRTRERVESEFKEFLKDRESDGDKGKKEVPSTTISLPSTDHVVTFNPFDFRDS